MAWSCMQKWEKEIAAGMSGTAERGEGQGVGEYACRKTGVGKLHVVAVEESHAGSVCRTGTGRWSWCAWA